jgi:hypothetical protein
MYVKRFKKTKAHTKMDAPKLKGQQTTLTIDQVIISWFLIPPFSIKRNPTHF